MNMKATLQYYTTMNVIC